MKRPARKRATRKRTMRRSTTTRRRVKSRSNPPFSFVTGKRRVVRRRATTTTKPRISRTATRAKASDAKYSKHKQRVDAARARSQKIVKKRKKVIDKMVDGGKLIHREIMKTTEKHESLLKKIAPLAKQIGYKIPVIGDGLRAYDFVKKIAKVFIGKTTEVPPAIKYRQPDMSIPSKYLKTVIKDASREAKKRDFSGADTAGGQAPQLLVGDHNKRVKRVDTVPMITNG